GGVEAARPPLRGAALHDEAGLLEHLEVAGDRGQAHRVRGGELVDGRLALDQSGEDRPPGRVGEGGERRAQLVSSHLAASLISEKAKYKHSSGALSTRTRSGGRVYAWSPSQLQRGVAAPGGTESGSSWARTLSTAQRMYARIASRNSGSSGSS